MGQHTIPDRGRVLTIEGTLVATSSSRHRSDKQRWAEYRLYRLTSGGYVVAGVGRSVLPGEEDRPWARTAETAASVVRALEREVRPGVWELPYTARLLLDEAAEADPAIAEVHRTT